MINNMILIFVGLTVATIITCLLVSIIFFTVKLIDKLMMK